MKKVMYLAIIMTAMVMTAAQAASYQYLNIEKTDGTGLSITATGLTITFSGTTLTATNGSETATIALNELNRMFFSDEAVSTGIQTVESFDTKSNQTVGDGIYSLQGYRLGNLSKRNSLRKGIYILRENGQTKKIQVK